MKPDEQELLTELRNHPELFTRTVIEQLHMNKKRAAYILEKWTERGWYDYGVNVFAGWLTGINHPDFDDVTCTAKRPAE